MRALTLWASAAALSIGALQVSAGELDCARLASAAPEGVTITLARATPSDADIPVDHCLVQGEMDTRVGMDGASYAIRFELRMPDAWEGRLLHQFNGGTDGMVVPALGRGIGIATALPALERGFAVFSSDAGHDSEAHTEMGLAGATAFGWDFEARRDFGYAAVARVHPVSLDLIETYYGRPPEYVYGYGTANGGRHALIAAERMPGAFDGLLAGYPSMNLPRSALQFAWDVQALLDLGPDFATVLERRHMFTVSGAMLEACDRLDGLEDGVIFATADCQAAFDIDTISCAEVDDGRCLPPAKVAALKRMHGGPVNAAGEALYNSWYWDAGLDTGNWRLWKLETPFESWAHLPVISVIGGASLAQVLTTPPTEVGGTPADLTAYLAGFDFDSDAVRIYATDADFPESAVEMMTPPNFDVPTLAGMTEAGGRVIVFHGVSDPVVSFKDTADWYGRLIANNPGAAKISRLYAIPGMPHGQGGNAPDEVDFLGALVAWVENGTAPGAVTATFRAGNKEIDMGNSGAERPLCPWPAYAAFTGDDPMKQGSFTCR